VNNTCLIVLTAGRLDYLDKTISSLNKNLKGNISKKFIIDNSDGPTINYDGYHTLKFPSFGFNYGEDRHSTVLRIMFKLFKQLPYENVVFFEEDWEIVNELNVDNLLPLINKDVCQVKFARNEKYMEYTMDKYEYSIVDDSVVLNNAKIDNPWFFSWNPSIFNKRIFDIEYPFGEFHEARFGKMVRGTKVIIPNYKLETVRHIGIQSILQPATWDEDGIVSRRNTDIIKE